MNLNKSLNIKLNDGIDYPKSLLKIVPDMQDFIKSGIMNDKLFNHMKNLDRFDFDSSMVFFKLRDQYIHDFGFTLLNQRLVNSLAESLKGKRVLEVGAGSGFLSKSLQNKNINITAIDLQPNESNHYDFKTFHTDILECNAIDYIKNNSDKFNAVIMAWPDYTSDFASDILKSLNHNHTLYYCGEGSGGCTANDEFFESLSTKTKLKSNLTNILNKDFISWPHINDKWQVFQIIKEDVAKLKYIL